MLFLATLQHNGGFCTARKPTLTNNFNTENIKQAEKNLPVNR